VIRLAILEPGPGATSFKEALLGPGGKIWPYIEGTDLPSGPVVSASPTRIDDRGEHQIINYFHVLFIRVPPLHTWGENAYIIQPDYPVGDQRRITIFLEPIRRRR